MIAPEHLAVVRASELRVIGCVLLGGSKLADEVLAKIDPDLCASDHLSDVLPVLRDLVDEAKPVDGFTLPTTWGRLHSRPCPVDITGSVDSVGLPEVEFPEALRDVVAYQDRRRLESSLRFALNELSDPANPVDSIRAGLVHGIEAQSGPTSPTLDSRQCARALIDDLQARISRKDQPSGYLTGLAKLDSILDGIQPGELTVLGARQGEGKTAFALTLANEICLRQRIGFAFLSLEMSPEPLLRRLCAMHCHIPAARLKQGQLSDADEKVAAGFAKHLSKQPFTILDMRRKPSARQIAGEIRRLSRQGVKVVCVDYLQKIRPDKASEKRTYEVGQASDALATVAHSTGVAVVALAQLSREPDKDKGRAPRLSDLADSAQIERDADNVLLLQRVRTDDDIQGRQARVFVAKQRDGEIGLATLRFEGEFCRFSNLPPE
jgi:replicative DNA helicase